MDEKEQHQPPSESSDTFGDVEEASSINEGALIRKLDTHLLPAVTVSRIGLHFSPCAGIWTNIVST
jgi:hypothetical protein